MYPILGTILGYGSTDMEADQKSGTMLEYNSTKRGSKLMNGPMLGSAPQT